MEQTPHGRVPRRPRSVGGWPLRAIAGGGAAGDESTYDESYWLRHSHGFLVDTTDGDEVGVVDDVELDAAGEVVTLSVRGGWFGRRRTVIPAESVRHVSPGDRRLYVTSASAQRS